MANLSYAASLSMAGSHFSLAKVKRVVLTVIAITTVSGMSFFVSLSAIRLKIINMNIKKYVLTIIMT